MVIDTRFDFRADSRGKGPDSHSPLLRSYHKLLWSKALPDGQRFELRDDVPGIYLQSELGKFCLASDSVIPTYTRWGFAKNNPDLVTKAENDEFMAKSYTIGGMMIFPGNSIERRWTINQARGCTRRISDRFDLTLECIRRHYLGQISPLGKTLDRYGDFFALFGSFRGYVGFFLLQDLVAGDSVQLFPPFDDFKTVPVPRDLDTYREYRRRTIEFIDARNRRIERYAQASR